MTDNVSFKSRLVYEFIIELMLLQNNYELNTQYE